MSRGKQLWILAGGNGAGKSTFFRMQLAPLGLPLVNADILAKELYPESPEEHSYDAALLASEMRSRLLQEGRSLCFETVFSHPSKIDFVARAETLGYAIVFVFIHLESVALNQARIAQRVSEGGHAVPSDKVEQRIPRTLVNVREALPLCDQVHILDNSRAEDPFIQVATIRDGHVETYAATLPDWATTLLEF